MYVCMYVGATCIGYDYSSVLDGTRVTAANRPVVCMYVCMFAGM